MDKSTVSFKVDDNYNLTATVTPADATNKAVTWSSSDDSVATVDNTGRVHGVKEGTANITVKTTDGNKTAVCAVTIEAKA